VNAVNDNIVRFFEAVRHDTGIQGELLSEIAIRAPEILAEVASGHGYEFPAEELVQVMQDREIRSLQGEVFWTQVLGQVLARAQGEPFMKIKGPSWVKQAPYRKTSRDQVQSTTTSLQDLYREIESRQS
jgi:hypothetical protein